MAFEFKSPIEGVSYVEIPVVGITNNIYVVGSRGEAILIDTGLADTACEIVETLEANDHEPSTFKSIVVTHGHLDHYGGASILAEWSGAEVWAHTAAAPRIEHHWMDFISRFDRGPNPRSWEESSMAAGEDVRVDRILRDGDSIDVAGMHLEVMHTPGHEHGLISLFEPERRFVLVGDLVQGGMKASENWLGLISDSASQRNSLQRLRALGAEWLFKGHRKPRFGSDVKEDISCALARLDAIETAVRDTLGDLGTASDADIAGNVYRRVLDREQNSIAPYTLMTVRSFLKDLQLRDAVRQTGNYQWELTGTGEKERRT